MTCERFTYLLMTLKWQQGIIVMNTLILEWKPTFWRKDFGERHTTSLVMNWYLRYIQDIDSKFNFHSYGLEHIWFLLSSVNKHQSGFERRKRTKQNPNWKNDLYPNNNFREEQLFFFHQTLAVTNKKRALLQYLSIKTIVSEISVGIYRYWPDNNFNYSALH